MSLRSLSVWVAVGVVAFVVPVALSHDREGRATRLTPPEGAPFPEARGAVFLTSEALAVKVEGLGAGEYQVLLDDGTGTLAPIGTIAVMGKDGEGEDDGDEGEDGEDEPGDGEGEGGDDDGEGEGDGHGDEGDGNGDGEGDGDDDGGDDGHDGDDGEGDDDGHDGLRTRGLLVLSDETLPFGVTSPLELAGRAIQIQDATQVTVLQGMTPSLPVEEPDEKEARCPLARPEPAPDPDAEGVLKLESGEGRVVIKVRLSHLTAGAIYDIVFTNPAGDASETAGMVTINEEESGQFKLDSAKGDAIPFGASDIAQLVGYGVSIKGADGSVVLAGTVCAPEEDDDDDDGHDDDDDGHDDDDDDDDDGEDDDHGDPPGADEPCEANLARPEPAPDADAAGEVEIEGEELEVEVENLNPETAYQVVLTNPADGASETAGEIKTGERGHGELEIEAEEGTPLPFGKASAAELLGFQVAIKDAEGTVVLQGTIPEILCEEEEDGHDDDGEDDGDDDGEDEEDDHGDGRGEDDGEVPGDGEPEGGGALLLPDDDGPLFQLVGEFDSPYLRGDSNGDALIDMADAINTLRYLFTGGTRPYCLDAADSNDDGRVDMSDPVHLLGHLFLGGTRPGAPGTFIPGSDPTADVLYCLDPPGA